MAKPKRKAGTTPSNGHPSSNPPWTCRDSRARRIILAAVASAGVAAMSFPWWGNYQARIDSPVTFEDAKAHPSKRQSFIDQFVRTLAVPKEVVSIEYRPTTIELLKEWTGVRIHDTPENFRTSGIGEFFAGRSSGLESRVYVRAHAFGLSTQDEFRGGLEAHEFVHARDLLKGFDFVKDDAFWVQKEGKKLLNTTLYYTVAELHGLSSQLEGAMRIPGVYSRRYIESLQNDWFVKYRCLWRFFPKAEDPLGLKERFFFDAMGNPPQRLVREYRVEEFGARYCIVPRLMKKAARFSKERWEDYFVVLPLPASLNGRIDAFFPEYVKAGEGYNPPEFDSLIRRTISRENRTWDSVPHHAFSPIIPSGLPVAPGSSLPWIPENR